MKILFFCPRWGSDHIPLEEFLFKVKMCGYDGVEIGIPENIWEKNRLLAKISDFDLKFIAQHYETGESNFEIHKHQFQFHMERIAQSNPYLLNSHTGKDFFKEAQNLELLSLAEKISADYGVMITHETHRGRFSFAAHAIEPFLEKIQFWLTLDVSHWICVAESLLYDQEEVLAVATAQTRHIHARIGHMQGPQVNDPRAPEWEEVLKRHLEIWDAAVTAQTKKGIQEMAITTEFGPWPYLPSAPISKQPFVSQWEANIWMLRRLKNHFSSKQPI